MEQFRTIKPDQAKDVGLQEFDGRRLHGFRVEQPGMTMTVWADPERQEPVRIESAFDFGSIPRTSSVMTGFEWDVPVDDAAMSLDVPPDYAVNSMTLDASPATEKDLLDGLRSVAKLNGGKFPASFDLAGLTGVLQSNAPKTKTADERKTFEAQVMPQVLGITRAFGFVNAGNGEDWHYAGDGVALDQPGRAVLWYRPKGATSYRVVNADLSVRADVPDADLPKADAKKLTPGPSPLPASKPAAEAKPAEATPGK